MDTMKDWMYWSRNPAAHSSANDSRWIKVFVVVKNEFLCLYQDSKSSKKPFIHIAITKVECSNNESFKIYDMNDAVVELYPYNKSKSNEWNAVLCHAAAMTNLHFNTFVLQMKNLPKRSLFHGSLMEFNKSQRKALHVQLLASVRQRIVRCVETIVECFDE